MSTVGHVGLTKQQIQDKLPDYLKGIEMHPKLLSMLPIEPVKSKPWKYQVAEPYISKKAKAAVVRAIDKTYLSSGSPVVAEMEEALRKFFKVPTACAVSNGQVAITLVLKAAGVLPGDDVIVPSMTMIAVGNSVVEAGANPIFVDNSSPTHYNPSAAEYRAAITPKTKAIIVTHTYGVPADMDGIVALCKEKNLKLIEDIAEAIGNTWRGKYLGTFGDYATGSLYANKLITAGDGGYILSNDANSAARIYSLINHGFVKTFHFLHFECSGNSKMNGLGAALVTPAIEDIPMLANNRNFVSQHYRKYLDSNPNVTCMEAPLHDMDAPWVFAVVMANPAWKNPVRQILADNQIETRNQFLPQHLQHCFKPWNNPDRTVLTNCETLYEKCFYLPTHSRLSAEDLEYITSVLEYAIAKVSGQPLPRILPVPKSAKTQMEEAAEASEGNSFSTSMIVKFAALVVVGVVSARLMLKN